MSAKRRRPSINLADKSKGRIKRTKFTLDSITQPLVNKSGEVLVCGAGELGQLGLGSDVMEKSRFCKVPISYEIIDVYAGGMHTVCLTKDGKVITFGCNDEGALGRDTSEQEGSDCTPGVVDLPSEVVQISVGDSHTAALLKDGRVFAWGTFRDSHGNMGMTTKGNEMSPFQIFSGAVKIASGSDHIVFLTLTGEVYTCGCAEQGQLGRTSERSGNRSARGGSSIDHIGKLLTPMPVIIKSRLKLHYDDIWAGICSTYVKVAGKDYVYVFGLNNYNQIGLETPPDVQFFPRLSDDFSSHKWKLICSALHHTIALDDNGKTYTLGRKEYGRLGLGQDTNDAQVLTLIPSLKDKVVVHATCGTSVSLAVTDSGELYGWGMGSVGQLGTGTEEDVFEPILIKSKQLTGTKVLRVSSGGQHTVILTAPIDDVKGDSKDINST